MPRVPGIEADVNAAGPTGFRPATANQYGGESAQALEQLGGTVDKVASHFSDIYQDSKASLQIAKSQRALQEYAFELKNGPVDPVTGQPIIDESTGLPKPPPDPSQHAALMQKRVDELREQGETDLGFNGKAQQRFSGEFESYAERQLLSTKTDAIDLIHGNLRATSQESLQRMADNAATADPLTRAQINAGAKDYVDHLVQSRVISPEQGFEMKKTYYHQTEVGAIRELLKKTDDKGRLIGPDLVRRAIDNGEFKDLPADVQAKWRGVAIQEGLMDVQRQNAREEHRQLVQKRIEHDQGVAVAKNLYQALAVHDPRVTIDNVIAAKNVLPKEDFKILLDDFSGHGAKKDNEQVATYLLAEAYTGKDNSEDVRAAGVNGTITRATVGEIYRVLEQRSLAFKDKDWGMAGQKEITQLLGPQPGDTMKFGMRTREVEALKQWTKFAIEHPDATQEQAEKVKRIIIRSATLIDFEHNPMGNLKPTYLKGGYEAVYGGKPHMALQEAYDATVKAAKDGEITPDELKRQKALLLKWHEMFPDGDQK